jgi:hypothetical protein
MGQDARRLIIACVDNELPINTQQRALLLDQAGSSGESFSFFEAIMTAASVSGAGLLA